MMLNLRTHLMILPSWLTLAYVCIALGVMRHNGAYTPDALVMVLVGAAALGVGAVDAWRRGDFGTPRAWRWRLVIALAVLIISGMLRHALMYEQHATYEQLFIGVNALVFVLVTFCYTAEKRAAHASTRWVFAGCVLLAFMMRVLIPWGSPAPIIDVFTMLQESAQHALHGLNPYSTPVSDVYQGSKGGWYYGYHLWGYAYLPANLYAHTLAYAAFGDVRYGYVVAEAVCVGVLWWLGRHAGQGSIAELAVLLFLFHPRGLFTLEQAWTEPLIAMMLALFVWWHQRCPNSLAGAAAYGVMLSLKQYLIFFVVHGLMLERRLSRIVTCVVVTLLTVAPFVLLDVHSFWQSAVMFQIKSPFRVDGLTVPALLYRAFGITVNKWPAASVGLVTSLVTFKLFARDGMRGFFFAASLTTLLLFLSSDQAFCNYYYFLSGLLCFLIIFCAHDATPCPDQGGNEYCP